MKVQLCTAYICLRGKVVLLLLQDRIISMFGVFATNCGMSSSVKLGGDTAVMYLLML